MPKDKTSYGIGVNPSDSEIYFGSLEDMGNALNKGFLRYSTDMSPINSTCIGGGGGRRK